MASCMKEPGERQKIVEMQYGIEMDRRPYGAEWPSGGAWRKRTNGKEREVTVNVIKLIWFCLVGVVQ